MGVSMLSSNRKLTARQKLITRSTLSNRSQKKKNTYFVNISVAVLDKCDGAVKKESRGKWVNNGVGKYEGRVN